MTRGTKRGSDGSHRGDNDKYDGSKRGYLPWKVKVNLRCLGNPVWEATFEGKEITLEGVAAGGLETWAKKYVRREYRMARDQKKFCEHDLLSGLLTDELIDFYKYVLSTLKGPAYNVVEKLTYKQSHKIDVSIQRFYGAQIDQEIPMMERGLREACFWNPNGQNFAVEFTERDIQCKLQDRSNMAHYFMGIEAMREYLRFSQSSW